LSDKCQSINDKKYPKGGEKVKASLRRVVLSAAAFFLILALAAPAISGETNTGASAPPPPLQTADPEPDEGGYAGEADAPDVDSVEPDKTAEAEPEEPASEEPAEEALDPAIPEPERPNKGKAKGHFKNK
jgi:hypothetical protein